MKGATKSSSLHRPRRTERKSQSSCAQSWLGRTQEGLLERGDSEISKQANEWKESHRSRGWHVFIISWFGVAMEVIASHGGQFGYSTVSQEGSGRDWNV